MNYRKAHNQSFQDIGGREKSDCFLTPSQAAGMLNISLSTLKKFIYTGRIKTFKTPGGHHRIRQSDLFAQSGKGEKTRPGLDEHLMTLSEAFLNMAQLRLKYCRRHAETVAGLSLEIGKAMGLSDELIKHLHFAARMHDIGMCAIDENILNKADLLTESEYRAVKMHPVLGGMMFFSLENCQDIADMIIQHHERWDGTGYPHRLKGEQICLGARIIAVAEGFASMTEADTYNHKMPHEKAVEDIIDKAGTYYDPTVVAAFAAVVRTKQ